MSALEFAREVGMVCDPLRLEHLNRCRRLRTAFPCEEGCARGDGAEQPAYVVDAEDPQHGHCLVRGKEVHVVEAAACGMRHQSTVRLCPCVVQRWTTVAAQLNESCTDACARHGVSLGRGPHAFRCKAEAIRLLNSCLALKAAFSCSVCKKSVGEDQPAFVSSRADPNWGACLFSSDSKSSCAANHPATRRLCPCVPVQT